MVICDELNLLWLFIITVRLSTGLFNDEPQLDGLELGPGCTAGGEAGGCSNSSSSLTSHNKLFGNIAW